MGNKSYQNRDFFVQVEGAAPSLKVCLLANNFLMLQLSHRNSVWFIHDVCPAKLITKAPPPENTKSLFFPRKALLWHSNQQCENTDNELVSLASKHKHLFLQGLVVAAWLSQTSCRWHLLGSKFHILCFSQSAHSLLSYDRSYSN